MRRRPAARRRHKRLADRIVAHAAAAAKQLQLRPPALELPVGACARRAISVNLGGEHVSSSEKRKARLGGKDVQSPAGRWKEAECMLIHRLRQARKLSDREQDGRLWSPKL